MNRLLTEGVAGACSGWVSMHPDNSECPGLTYRLMKHVQRSLRRGFGVAVFSLSCGGISGVAGAQPAAFDSIFPDSQWYSASRMERCLVSGDINGDGREDLVTSGYLAMNLSVLLSDGADLFHEAIEFPLADSPDCIATGDLDENGTVDLIVGLHSGTLQILLSASDGSLNLGTTLKSDPFPAFLASPDIDADGHLDIAVGVPGGIDVYLGHGDGTFEPQVFFEVERGGRQFAFADFNADGVLDAANNASFNGFSVLLGTVEGLFADPIIIPGPIGQSWTYVSAADLNVDGADDLIFANLEHDDITVLIGHGDGTFAEPVHYDVGQGPSQLVNEDFNGDGFPDVAVANETGGTMSVRFGIGDGTLGPEHLFGTREKAVSIVAGEFDARLGIDIAIACGGNNTGVNVLRNVGDGTFSPDRRLLGRVQFLNGVAAEDVSGDRVVDLVVANFTAHEVVVLCGDGAGDFLPPVAFDVGQYPNDLDVADLNGDGVADVVCICANSGGDDISILIGDNDGGFEPEVRLDIEATSGGPNPLSLDVADLNADGDSDIILTVPGSQKIYLFFGHGDGTFGAPVEADSGVEAFTVEVADFDGDDILDYCINNGENVRVRRGIGDGSFADPVISPVGSGVIDIATGDMNEDGVLDLAVMTYSSAAGRQLAILCGAGDGSFLSPLQIDDVPNPEDVELADFDRDGHLDLVSPSNFDASVFLIRGSGDGTFAEVADVIGPGLAEAIAVADFDGDGWPDFAATGRNYSGISVRLNAGGSSCLGDVDGNGLVGFADLVSLLNDWGPCEECGGDLNTDGEVSFLDLVALLGAWGPC